MGLLEDCSHTQVPYNHFDFYRPTKFFATPNLLLVLNHAPFLFLFLFGKLHIQQMGLDLTLHTFLRGEEVSFAPKLIGPSCSLPITDHIVSSLV